jgi:hypothetical protein
MVLSSMCRRTKAPLPDLDPECRMSPDGGGTCKGMAVLQACTNPLTSTLAICESRFVPESALLERRASCRASTTGSGTSTSSLLLDNSPHCLVWPEIAHRLTFAFLFAYDTRRMMPLTKRQREILDYLNEFIQRHGYAPSLEEIGKRSASPHSPRSTSTSPTFRKKASSSGRGIAAARWSSCPRGRRSCG